MNQLAPSFETDRRPDGVVALHFTPTEWRAILRDPNFLREPDNEYRVPRRIFGVEVRIVPDHSFG
jgi:hypothetical protein